MSVQKEMQKLKLTPLPMHNRAVPILMFLDEESLSKEITQRVKENDVESIVFRDKVDSINANYTVTYRKEDKISELVSYEIYIAE